MATADSVLTTVYFRLRDTSRVATPQATALLFLGHAQRAINLFLRLSLSKVTLSTEANRTIYDILEPSGTDLARVDSVQDGGKDLSHLPLGQLWARDPGWLRATGASFQGWSRLGRRLVAVFPAKTGSSSVTLVGPTLLPLFSGISDNLSVRDEWLPLLENLTEALCCLRLRLLPEGVAALKRATEMLGLGPETGESSILLGSPDRSKKPARELPSLAEQPEAPFKELAGWALRQKPRVGR